MFGGPLDAVKSMATMKDSSVPAGTVSVNAKASVGKYTSSDKLKEAGSRDHLQGR
jgi:hypothetical protein